MKILVTGGAGFIGSHLCGTLLEERHKVYCLDNFCSCSRDNVTRFSDNPNFHLVEHDVTEPIMDIDGVDQIFNLACPASPVWYQKDPVKTVRTNIEGAIHVLDLARRCGARVLQASTSEIYGDPLEHPQRESYRGNVNTLGPRACYDEGKRVAETVFMDYHRQFGVEVRIARIFNTYGPSMAVQDGRVVSNFITQALRQEPVTIYGDGTQTRSFQYVSDLISGLVKLMHSDYLLPVNLGNPGEFNMYELAQKVIAMTESSSIIVKESLPEDDPMQRRPDISLAKSVLDWSPLVSLDEGLELTVPYFKRLLGIL